MLVKNVSSLDTFYKRYSAVVIKLLRIRVHDL